MNTRPARIHPCQDSGETAKELVRAAAYTAEAEWDRQCGRETGFSRRCATEATERARRKLTVTEPGFDSAEVDGTGPGGELILGRGLIRSDVDACRLVDTLRNPDRLAASAELKRLTLAERTGSLDIALDLADTIKPRNNMERMLAHQLGTLHHAAMNMTETALKWQQKADPDRPHVPGRGITPQVANLEASRALGAAARLMQTFQEGMMTLAKFRSGGRQSINVTYETTNQNVKAENGAQIVVAGKLAKGAGAGARGKGRGKRK